MKILYGLLPTVQFGVQVVSVEFIKQMMVVRLGNEPYLFLMKLELQKLPLILKILTFFMHLLTNVAGMNHLILEVDQNLHSTNLKMVEKHGEKLFKAFLKEIWEELESLLLLLMHLIFMLLLKVDMEKQGFIAQQTKEKIGQNKVTIIQAEIITKKFL